MDYLPNKINQGSVNESNINAYSVSQLLFCIEFLAASVYVITDEVNQIEFMYRTIVNFSRSIIIFYKLVANDRHARNDERYCVEAKPCSIISPRFKLGIFRNDSCTFLESIRG